MHVAMTHQRFDAGPATIDARPATLHARPATLGTKDLKSSNVDPESTFSAAAQCLDRVSTEDG